MPRGAPRQRLAPCIYTDGGKAIEIDFMVRGARISERHPAGTSLDYLIERRDYLKANAATVLPPSPKGTLAGDAPLYLRLIRALHPTTVKSRKAHLDAWIARLPKTPRHKITAHDVLEARAAWLEAGRAPKTINHRVHTLRRLYRTLDGKRAASPVDDIDPLPVHRTPIQRVSPETILAVHRALYAAIDLPIKAPSPATLERATEARKTHARFCVLVSTGKRPSELMRAEPGDVNLEQRVWVIRDGKGGWSPGLYLNDDMLAAWSLFIAADAWGAFSTSAYAKRLRRAGWPDHVRPYNARHSLLIALVESGADLADAQVFAGHKSLATTRAAYVGVRNSRMQQTSERLDGRLLGLELPGPRSGAGRKGR